jgi:isocitrate/isopropylmalate dehydrogenase
VSMTRVAYIPGDGIGPEVLASARRVLEAAGLEVEWVDVDVGWAQWCRVGDALPKEALLRIRTTKAALFGAITSKGDVEAEAELAPALRGRGLKYRSPILRLRQELDLWANVRPTRAFSGNPNNLSADVDLVIFRENTEGLYAGVELHPFPVSVRSAWQEADPKARLPEAGEATAVSLRVITQRSTRRIVEAAFQYAQAQGRRLVTLVEKANVLRATGGLVRRVFFEVAKAHPGIQTQELHVDAACALLVRHPERFDVVVATNLFGDILSDVAAEVAGGLPLAASANQGDSYALFEPVHGSAPDIAGQAVADPLGACLAGAMLARHLGQAEVANRVESAVERLVAEGRHLPRDLGGSASTKQVEARLLALLSAPESRTPST